jgi:uncharacterized protein (TIGR03437 family)
VVLSVGGTPDFSVGVSPSSQTVVAGQQVVYTVTVSSAGGFNSAVALTCAGLPTGVSCSSFSPASVTPSPTAAATSALTVSAAANATAGTAAFTVAGTSGTTTRSGTAALVVGPGLDFSLSASPASQSVSPGSTATYTVTIAAIGGFNSAVSLACTGLPAGVSCAFSANPAMPGTGTLTVSTPASMSSRNLSFTVGGTSGSLSHSTAVTLTVGTPPVIPSDSVTNGASFSAGASAGSIITIFGTRLTGLSAGTVVAADKLPLPTDLRGVSVTINGVPAPLFAIANVNGIEQINLQIPFEVTGLAKLTIVVTVNGAISDPVEVALQQQQPGIFVADWTTGAGAILHGADYALVSTSNAARRGEVVLIYATGLGPVRNAPATGRPASSSPLSETTVVPTVTFGGATATEVLFSGLAPGYVGLYQVNVRVPPNTPSGIIDVVIHMGGQTSKAAKMAVQ